MSGSGMARPGPGPSVGRARVSALPSERWPISTGGTRRWMLDPALMSPGTAMPSGLFREQDHRMVFAGPTPASFNGYQKDHAELLVRYMFQFTPEELSRMRAGIK